MVFECIWVSFCHSIHERGGRTPWTGHTFCIHSVRCLNYKSGGIWVYLSVFLSLYSRKGGGRLPVQGPSPPLSTGNWPPPSCTDSPHPGHVQSVQKYIHMLRLKLHSVGEPFILKKWRTDASTSWDATITTIQCFIVECVFFSFSLKHPVGWRRNYPRCPNSYVRASGSRWLSERKIRYVNSQ